MSLIISNFANYPVIWSRSVGQCLSAIIRAYVNELSLRTKRSRRAGDTETSPPVCGAINVYIANAIYLICLITTRQIFIASRKGPTCSGEGNARERDIYCLASACYFTPRRADSSFGYGSRDPRKREILAREGHRARSLGLQRTRIENKNRHSRVISSGEWAAERSSEGLKCAARRPAPKGDDGQRPKTFRSPQHRARHRSIIVGFVRARDAASRRRRIRRILRHAGVSEVRRRRNRCAVPAVCVRRGRRLGAGGEAERASEQRAREGNAGSRWRVRDAPRARE